jgi:hypothetical protein
MIALNNLVILLQVILLQSIVEYIVVDITYTSTVTVLHNLYNTTSLLPVSAVCCLLSAVCCLLSAICYLLPVSICYLPTANRGSACAQTPLCLKLFGPGESKFQIGAGQVGQTLQLAPLCIKIGIIQPHFKGPF